MGMVAGMERIQHTVRNIIRTDLAQPDEPFDCDRTFLHRCGKIPTASNWMMFINCGSTRDGASLN